MGNVLNESNFLCRVSWTPHSGGHSNASEAKELLCLLCNTKLGRFGLVLLFGDSRGEGDFGTIIQDPCRPAVHWACARKALPWGGTLQRLPLLEWVQQGPRKMYS